MANKFWGTLAFLTCSTSIFLFILLFFLFKDGSFWAEAPKVQNNVVNTVCQECQEDLTVPSIVYSVTSSSASSVSKAVPENSKTVPRLMEWKCLPPRPLEQGEGLVRECEWVEKR